MLKRIMVLAFIMVFSAGLVGCEPDSEKSTTVEKQKKEESKDYLESAFKPSEKRSW